MNKIILTILFSAAFLISGFSQGIKLSLQLPEGYRFTTETSVNLIVEQEFMGIRYNTQMEIATVLHLQVNGMDSDTSYVLSASYQKMDIRVSSILINMEVSTEWKNSQDSLSSVLRSMLGKEFSILLSDKGLNSAGISFRVLARMLFWIITATTVHFTPHQQSKPAISGIRA